MGGLGCSTSLVIEVKKQSNLDSANLDVQNKLVGNRKRRAQRRSSPSKIPVGVLDLEEDENEPKSKLGSLVYFFFFSLLILL